MMMMIRPRKARSVWAVSITVTRQPMLTFVGQPLAKLILGR
jgi:hypothetical protein